MKKLFAILLVLTLTCAMGVTAFAASDTLTGTGSKDIDVKAQYADGTTTRDAYSVDLEWGAMEFTYSAAGQRVWNPATHTYTDSTTASWSANGNNVTVTNHSNTAVTTRFAFAKSVTENINDSINYSGDRTLTAGVEGSPTTAAKVTATLTLAGALDSSRTTLQKIGTVTVTLS